MRPFCKWVGGKQRSLKYLEPLLPQEFEVYHEPFLGGGAVFLRLLFLDRIHHGALLYDLNYALVDMWNEVKEDPERVIYFLQMYQDNDNKEFFLRMRKKVNLGPDAFPEPGAFGAAFLYLNRAGYNGLYRVNKSGHFNVPFSGQRKLGHNICKAEDIRLASWFMDFADAEVHQAGYAESLEYVQEGDFVYCDPPYDDSYASYTNPPFNEFDQAVLAERLSDLADRAYVMVSNSDTPFVRELYKDFFIFETRRVNSVNANGEDRKMKVDLCITNYMPLEAP